MSLDTHGSMQPHILTLMINRECMALFDDLRRKHFPAELNFIGAHLTLFHKLPPTERALSTIDRCAREKAAFPIIVQKPFSIGRGVAFAVQSRELLELRGMLAKAFHEFLTPQDRQGYRPHITVQNKVAPEKARALLSQLDEFKITHGIALGMTVWEYCGGPWKKVRDVNFRLDG